MWRPEDPDTAREDTVSHGVQSSPVDPADWFRDHGSASGATPLLPIDHGSLYHRDMEATREIRVGIVEDEAMIRSMLANTLDAETGLRVIHVASGVADAKLLFTPGSCDVAILDVNLGSGNGISLGLQLQRADPRLGVMLLSSQDAMGLFNVVQDEASRPWSYLSKRSSFSRDVLVRAVHATAAGEVVIDPFLLRRSEPRAGSDIEKLTRSQFTTLRLVAEGFSNAAVAEKLGIAERSVESHLLSTYQKLGISGEGQNRRVAAVLKFLTQTGRN